MPETGGHPEPSRFGRDEQPNLQKDDMNFPARIMASRRTTTAYMRRYTMPFRWPLVLVVSALILSMACSDRGNLTDPVSADVPSFAIADAARGFKSGFYWLPPMVANPMTNGTFDAELSPVVEICPLAGNACDPASGLVETFVMDGSGSTGIRVSDSHYIVNWHLGDYDLTASTNYRITVFAGPGVLLGYADVELVSNGSGLKNVNTGEYIGLVDGRFSPPVRSAWPWEAETSLPREERRGQNRAHCNRPLLINPFSGGARETLSDACHRRRDVHPRVQRRHHDSRARPHGRDGRQTVERRPGRAGD